jgi:hypothetical protein
VRVWRCGIGTRNGRSFEVCLRAFRFISIYALGGGGFHPTTGSRT